MGLSHTAIERYKFPDKLSPDFWFNTEENASLLTWHITCIYIEKEKKEKEKKNVTKLPNHGASL